MRAIRSAICSSALVLALGCSQLGLYPAADPADEFYRSLAGYNAVAAVAERVEDDPATPPEVAARIDRAQRIVADTLTALPPQPSASQYEAAANILDAAIEALRLYGSR
jgi:hypothetical protein